MKRTSAYWLARFDNVFLGLLALMTVVIICVKFVLLPNNLIFSDEGWYLCLLRDLPHDRNNSTRFFLLFNNVFHNDIYVIRLANLFSQFLASVLFSIGLTIWIGQKHPNSKKWEMFLLLFCASYLGQMEVEPCPSFNYINMNKICVEVGVGFLFLGLARQKSWYYLCSGMMLAVLFPVMITNVIIIPLAFGIILFFSKRNATSIMWFGIGIMLFLVSYFVFIEPPSEVFDFLFSQTKTVVDKGNNDYGILFLFGWVTDSIMYLSKWFFIALLFCGLYHLMFRRNRFGFGKTLNKFAFGVLLLIIMVYSWNYVSPIYPFVKYHAIQGTKDMYWLFLFILVLLDIDLLGKKKYRVEELILSVFLMLIPVMLSFGSNVAFYYRQSCYFAFITPLIILYSVKLGRKGKIFSLFFFITMFVVFIIGLFGKNWHGEKYFGDHAPVRTIGIDQNVKLTSQYVNQLETCQKLIPKGKILCDQENWGVICLLNYTPACYDFAISRWGVERIHRIVEKTINEEGELWVITRHDRSTCLVDALLLMQGYEMCLDTIESNTYIHIRKSNISNCNP